MQVKFIVNCHFGNKNTGCLIEVDCLIQVTVNTGLAVILVAILFHVYLPFYKHVHTIDMFTLRILTFAIYCNDCRKCKSLKH